MSEERALAILPAISQMALAERGAEAIEAEVALTVRGVDDPDALIDWLARAKALASYLATRKGAQGPMQGSQRRIEARIGELLGEPKEGRPPSNVVREQRLSELDGAIRSDFRLLAHAYSDAPLTDEEWRHSRRTAVQLVRKKLGLVPETPPLPTGQFATIVADPPWQLNSGQAEFGTPAEGHDDLPYFSMALEDICALGLPLEPHLPADAHLYLWTTNRYVEAAYQVARDWGFKPSVLLVWAKAPRGVGLGDAFKLTTEFVLFARRGSLANLDITPTTWFDWPRGKHSVKPDAFYALVERMSPGPRLEMFGRDRRDGWTVWGDEAPDE
jgi:N6-adenosine-specific RNA methylase IME4